MSISIARAKIPTETFPLQLEKGLLGCLTLVLADSQDLACTIAGHSGWAAVQGPEACAAEDVVHGRQWQSR